MFYSSVYVLLSIVSVLTEFGCCTVNVIPGKGNFPVDYKMTIHVTKRKETLEYVLAKYDKRDPPSRNETTKISLSIFVNGFNDISEATMDYTITLFLHQEWIDPRLRFIPLPGENISVAIVKAEDSYWQHFWMPDIFFRNEKMAKFHKVSVENRYIRVYSNVSSTDDTQKYSWKHNPVEFQRHIRVPKFRLTNWTVSDCSRRYISGTFSCQKVDFIFERDIGYYLIQMYFPSILVVILSWVAFWISFDAVPARITIGLLTVLTISTQNASAQHHLPRVSYIKALDVWMIVCLVFVFAALIEYAIVNVCSRYDEEERERLRQQNALFKAISQTEQVLKTQILGKKHTPLATTEKKSQQTTAGVTEAKDEDELHHEGRARHIDKFSRKLFPIAFCMFNMVYWFLYLVLL